MRTLIGFSVVGWLTLAAGLNAAGQISLTPKGNTSTVEVRLPQLDGVLTLRAPEVIHDPTQRLVYTNTNLNNVHWQVRKHGALSSGWRREGLAAYRMTLTPEADGVQLDLTVTNLRQEVWKNAAGDIDMQSHSMGTFFDLTGDRVFLRSNGRWVTAKDSWNQPGKNWYMPPGEEPLPLMRPFIEDGSWKLSQFHPDESIVALQSGEGGWILAQAWQRSQYFVVNIHDHYQCSEPPPSLGDIDPGQTAHIRGKVYLFHGSLDELETKYRADLKAQHIFLRSPK